MKKFLRHLGGAARVACEPGRLPIFGLEPSLGLVPPCLDFGIGRNHFAELLESLRRLLDVAVDITQLGFLGLASKLDPRIRLGWLPL